MKLFKYLTISLMVFFSISSSAQITKLRDLTGVGTNGRVSEDQFGYSVAISGDVIVVGTPYQNYDSAGGNSVSNAGAAYIFHKNQGGANNWGFVKKITGKGTHGRITNDYFGWSVAISGDIIVVGAYGQDYDSAGGDSLYNAGAAYIFNKNSGGADNWGFIKKVTGTDTNGRNKEDYFGYSLAISNDNIVIGASRQDYDSSGGNYMTDAGAAYVFNKNRGGTNNWGSVKKLTGVRTNGRGYGDGFGESVAINNDIIVVGAPFHPFDATGNDYLFLAGAAFVFSRNNDGTDNWGYARKLSELYEREEDNKFGWRVAVSGDVIAVASIFQDYDSIGANPVSEAGKVWLLEKDGPDQWGYLKELTGKGTNGRGIYDLFGSSLSLSEDVIIVGVAAHDYDSAGGNYVGSAGAAYVFDRSIGGPGMWGLMQKINGTGTNGRKAGDQFSFAVATDGETIVAGIPTQDYDTAGGDSVNNAGKVSVYDYTTELQYSNNSWSPYAPNSATANRSAIVYSGSPALSSIAQVNNLTIASGATPGISTGTFTVNGDYTNNGTISGAGSITLAGSSAQTIYGSGVTHNLVLNNSAGATISSASGDSLLISGLYTHTAGTLTTNGKLKLKATGATTYAQIAGTGSGAISGNVTSEYQVLTGGSAWRPVCSPLNGVEITQFDVYMNFGSPTYNHANVFTFNESRSPSWQVPSSTLSMNDSCASIYMFATDHVGIPVTLGVTGTYRGTADYTLNNLTYTGSVTDTSGWHYIRNPWPSGFLWDGTISNIQGNQVYVYDQNGGAGGFYRVFDNTSNGVVPPFTPLLVQVSSNNVSVTLPNSKRNTDSLRNYMDKTFPVENYVELAVQKEGAPVTEYVKFYTDASAKNTFDVLDGVKHFNDPSMPNMYFTMGMDKLNKQVFNDIPPGTTKLPMLFKTTANGKYIFNPRIENLSADVEVFIEDLNTGNNELYPVNTNTPVAINYTGSGEAYRYNLVFVRKSANTAVQEDNNTQALFISQNDKTLFINGHLPAHTQITVTDILGRVWMQQTTQETVNGITQINIQQLPAGYYIVNLNGETFHHTQKIISK